MANNGLTGWQAGRQSDRFANSLNQVTSPNVRQTDGQTDPQFEQLAPNVLLQQPRLFSPPFTLPFATVRYELEPGQARTGIRA